MNIETSVQQQSERIAPSGRFDFSPAAVLALARRHLGSDEWLFYRPDIPAAKEEGARHGCALSVPPDLPLLVLYDDTVLGDASNGFVLTTWGLLWKSPFEFADRLPWNGIDAATLEDSVDGVRVNGRDIKIMKAGLRAGFIGLVRELAGYAHGTQGLSETSPKA